MSEPALLIGADPELFVRKKSHIISGHTFPCGTKQHPMRTEHGYIQVDGIALECNVRPSSSRDAFITNVGAVLADLRSVVHTADPTADLVAKPSVFFGHKKLSTLPPFIANLGCTADYNAWTGRRNPPPRSESPIRTGAGHIHLGWTQDAHTRSFEYHESCAELVRQLDYYLGLPSLYWDKDARRRSLYGQAGAFRPKSYGLEYRVLSNAWLRSEKMIGWVYDRAVAAFTDFHNGVNYVKEYGNLAQNWIDNSADWINQPRGQEIADRVLV